MGLWKGLFSSKILMEVELVREHGDKEETLPGEAATLFCIYSNIL
jgi:hypothetical protein